MTWGRDTDEHEAAEQFRFYLDAGGNFIDTAAVYGDGDAERVLGGLLGVLGNRDEIVLATKAGISFKSGERKVDNSRTSLIGDLEKSLVRLKTDYVDLWQVHTWDETTPLEETLSAMDYALSSGKARHVGVLSTQNEYSLLNRRVEREVLPACLELDIGFLAWSPLGRGVLTGKYRSGLPSDSRGASPHFSSFIEPYLDERSSRIVEAVMVAADGLGYSPLEIALAWVRDCPGVTSAVIGARTGAQLRGALSSENVNLPMPVREALDEVSVE
jgi:aryl-alcohol dehydrogenase-like predicted oxidoreductase